jgi:hypothetical protein
MTFVNPTLAIVGLACVAIPIIIHILMRRRRRPVPWGAMKFLIEAYRRQRRRLNLEQILLLASRCLLVALLALALGKPVLAGLGALAGPGSRTLYILIDNSLAAGLIDPLAPPGSAGEQAIALDKHLAAAAELLAQLDASRGDRAAVITLAGPAQAVAFPPSAEFGGVREAIREVRLSHSRADLAGALSLISDQRGDEAPRGNAWVALLSDWRAGSADVDAVLRPLSASLGAVKLLVSPPAPEPADNTWISSVEPDRPVLLSGTDEDSSGSLVRVTLGRSGPGASQAATTAVRLTGSLLSATGTVVQEVELARGEVSWRAGQEGAEVFLSARPPAGAAPRTLSSLPFILTASLVDQGTRPDLLRTDDAQSRPIQVRDRIEIAVIDASDNDPGANFDRYTPSQWLALALSPRATTGLSRADRGELRVEFVDPRRVAPGAGLAGVLRTADAVFVARPDALDSAGWRSLREAHDRGVLLVIFPPATPASPAWIDAMTSALGLSWDLARESVALSPPLGLVMQPGEPNSLVAGLAAEATELLRPVLVERVLPPLGGVHPSDVLLSLADGRPFLIAEDGLASEATTGQDSPPAGAALQRGIIVYMSAACSLAWTDLPTKPLMVPLIQEIVRQGIGRSGGVPTVPSGVLPVLSAGASEIVRAASESTAGATIAIGPGGIPNSVVREAGVWVARASSGAALGALTFTPDTRASITDTRTQEQIEQWLTPSLGTPSWLRTAGESPQRTGEAGERVFDDARDLPSVSLPLLIAAACIALIELVLARFFSHATRLTGASPKRSAASTPAAQPSDKGAKAA